MTDVSAGTLTYQFKADLSDLRKGLADIKAQLSQMGTQAQAASLQIRDGMEQARKASDGLTQSAGQGRTVLGSFVQGIAFGGAVTGLLQLRKAVADYVSDLREMSDVAKRTYQDVSQISGLVAAGQKSGVKSETITAGLDKLGAKANTEFREGEGELTKLLEANNLKLTDRAGKLRSANDLLMDAARLVRDANTEYDKIDIARVFGLTKEWVDLLEKGPESLRQTQAEIMTTGGRLDDELIKKVKDFDDAWRNAWVDFVNYSKSSIVDVSSELATLAERARNFLGLMKDSKAAAGFGPLGVLLGHLEDTETSANEITVNPKRQNTGFYPRLSKTYEPTDKKTKIPKDKEDDGGPAETKDAVERYLESLKRSRDVLKQEIDLWGKARTEVEAAKALEMARAAAKKEGRDLTEAEVQKVRQLGTAYGSLKDKLEELRDRQQSMLQIAQTFSSAIADWAINGTKAKDVFASLAKSIANMALQATLMGQGPLAGLFGTKSADGGNSLGGLFGSLVGGLGSFKLPGFAAGGTVPGNQWAVVGEQGPELIRSGSGGATVIPNGGITGSGVPVVNVHNYAGAAVQVKQSKGPTGPSIDVVLTELVLRDVNQRGPISQALGARRF